VKRIVEACNELPVHPRHPWAGELVYTAFSGSHQDAIKKGMHAQQQTDGAVWDVPYLPIDPHDVGRSYEAIIRVNSQSGKGGVAFLLASRYGLELPRGLQVEFAQKVQAITDARGGELSSEEIYEIFRTNYLAVETPYEIVSYRHDSSESGDRLTALLRVDGKTSEIVGDGNGPIAAFVHSLAEQSGLMIHVLDYHEHAMSTGEDATAAAYVNADIDGEAVWGVGLHPSIVTASLRALVNAVDRTLLLREQQQAAVHAFQQT
jgi:2-isopropylmalate synthase